MKRVAAVLVLGCMVAALAGCGSAPKDAAGASGLTATPIPVKTASLPTYTSEALGLEFTMPCSWAGKYRVVEGSGSLTVYFNPAQAPDPNVGDGELFCIVRKTASIDMTMYDNAREIKNFSGTFIWSEPEDMHYQRGQPEYDTYVAMRKNVLGIYYSVSATPCKTFQPLR